MLADTVDGTSASVFDAKTAIKALEEIINSNDAGFDNCKIVKAFSAIVHFN